MIQCRNSRMKSIIARIYWLICIVYITVESALRLYMSFANKTRSITNAQPVGVEWYLLSYALIACMTFASIIYSYESAKYIFVNNVLNDHRYTILVLKNTGIVIAEIIMIVTPFVVSRIWAFLAHFLRKKHQIFKNFGILIYEYKNLAACRFVYHNTIIVNHHCIKIIFFSFPFLSSCNHKERTVSNSRETVLFIIFFAVFKCFYDSFCIFIHSICIFKLLQLRHQQLQHHQQRPHQESYLHQCHQSHLLP